MYIHTCRDVIFVNENVAMNLVKSMEEYVRVFGFRKWKHENVI